MKNSLSRRSFVRGATATALLPLSMRATRLAAETAVTLPAHSDITDFQATELSAAIKSRAVSCEEVMTAYLQRIGRFNGTYNAIVSLADEAQLLEQARAADAELVAGQYRGWMHGIPHAIKDLADLKGFINTGGSPLFKDYVSQKDSLFVERIRKAGAIFMGKTNVPEWGLGSQSYNPVFGVTGSAYNPALTAGGSSGGAACGLATHMLPVADGSDMMGSLRNPAAFNNVIGFRPSQGRVPGRESDLFFQQLACEGPMGRSVADVTALLRTMAGYAPDVPLSNIPPLATDDPAIPALKDVKLGWLGNYDGYLPMEAGVMDVCETSLRQLEGAGCVVEPCQPDFAPQTLWETWLTLRHWTISNGALALYEDPEKRAQMKPELIWEVEGGLSITGAAVAKASRDRSSWYSALRSLFETFDFLVLPTAQVFPFDKTIHWPKEIAGKSMDTYHRWMEVVIGGTLSGCPVLNLPAGFGKDGRPMGTQVIAPLGRDLELLAFGRAYEEVTDFLSQRPKLVESTDA